MFGIGGFELFLILLFGFLIFGPDKLPALAKTVGKAIGKFRDAQAEMTEQLKLDELLKQDAAKPDAKAKGTAKGSGQPAKRAASEADAPADEKPLSFSERKARYEQARAEAAKADAAKADAKAAASAADSEEASR